MLLAAKCCYFSIRLGSGFLTFVITSHPPPFNHTFHPSPWPHPPLSQAPRCENELEELCREVEKAITQNIQNTLNTLEKDAITIATQIDAALERDR